MIIKLAVTRAGTASGRPLGMPSTSNNCDTTFDRRAGAPARDFVRAFMLE